MITVKEAWSYLAHLQSIYTIKQPANPEIYLGALYTGSPKGDWTISCEHYIKEGLSRIEWLVGTLREEKTPTVTGDHPEQDESLLLDNEQHRLYQQLIGMGQWLVTLG